MKALTCPKCGTPLQVGMLQSGFRVEAVVDCPDLADLFIQELASAGYPPGMFELTAAVIETSYVENGVRMRQKSWVNTQRQRSGVGALFGSPPLWTASLDVYYRAPENEFAAWEPVLCGIMDSSRPNPAWQRISSPTPSRIASAGPGISPRPSAKREILSITAIGTARDINTTTLNLFRTALRAELGALGR